MEVKIKQGSEMLDATIEMVDGVMVVSPKEKFEPKDGDVCCSQNCVYIYKSLRDYKTIIYYCAMYKNGEHITIKEDVGVGFIHDGCHYFATEKEKKLLFDKLAEKGYEWKADTKELVKLKWEPKEGEQFWFPIYYTASTAFSPISTLFDSERDMMLLDKGWCFKTKEECQNFCNRLNDAIISVKP